MGKSLERRFEEYGEVISAAPGACGSAHAGAVVFARFDAARGTQERGADGGARAAAERALGASVDASLGGRCATGAIRGCSRR